MEAFLKEVEALCKSHGITSFGNMCYNDPALCEKQAIDFAKFEDELRKYQDKLKEFRFTNPEPDTRRHYSEWQTWRSKMYETVGSCPYAPGDNLHFDYDKDDSPKPGVWFSSKC